jgi:hypothetical protein
LAYASGKACQKKVAHEDATERRHRHFPAFQANDGEFPGRIRATLS